MNKEIFRLAVPNIISNITIPLLSSVDTALMGHLSGGHLAAVGIGSMIFNYLYWNFGFLRMGTTGMTAQAFGKGSMNEASNILFKAVLISSFLSILLILAMGPLEHFGLRWLNQSDQLVPYISEYFSIRIWGAPANLILLSVMGWFFGLQNAIVPLVLTLIVNISNIALSYYGVYHLNLGIKGVAWGTVLAQYLGLFFAVFVTLKIHGKDLKNIQFDNKIEDYKKFFLINRDIFLRTLCLTSVFAFIYSQSSAFGVTILAVNTIFLQLLNWVSYGIDGLAFASESLVGKYHGAKDQIKLSQTIRYCFNWSLLFAVFYSIFFLFFGNFIVELFTTDMAVIEASREYVKWFALLPLIAYSSYIWDGVYIGLTASRAMRNCMFLAFIVFLASYYGLESSFQNYAIWMALASFLLSRSAFQWLYYRHYGVKLS